MNSFHYGQHYGKEKKKPSIMVSIKKWANKLHSYKTISQEPEGWLPTLQGILPLFLESGSCTRILHETMKPFRGRMTHPSLCLQHLEMAC